MAKTLTIIILNYNTKDLLSDCLNSLRNVKSELDFDVIVCDNGSSDQSVEYIKRQYPEVQVVDNGANIGFAKGNNAARKYVKTPYVLFLNSDTKVHKGTLRGCYTYMEKNKVIGGLTCKLILPNGDLDKDARRSFITPWIAFVHLFLRLDRIFPKSKMFGQYWYGYISPDTVHEIDAIQGAFLYTKKKILDEVGWFDEDYFLDAEDIDLSWKIKKLGYKNIYYPKFTITHVKGATKGNNSKNYRSIPLSEKLKYRLSGVRSMEIFYKKRLWKHYPLVLNYVVLLGINVLKLARTIKVVVS
jgi:GT2 family glycosyltransferase